jgi:hypothetical protein
MKTKETAAQAYQRNQEDLGALLDALAQEVRMAADYAAKDGMDWSKVGSLAEIRSKLVETLAFLAQQDEAFIEKRLADARQGRK